MIFKHAKTQALNHSDFVATYSEAKIIETDYCEYKHVNMGGETTFIYWKSSGRISYRKGFVTP